MTVHTTPDPDAYRTNLRGRRHYLFDGHDPMPSATSIKPPKEFRSRTPLGTSVPLDVLRAAEWVLDNRRHLDEVTDADLLIEEISISPQVALRKASQRGTNVHDAIAAYILGQDDGPELNDDELGFYRAALEFIDDYQVEFIAAEVVVVVPAMGVAGTVDWIGRTNGRAVIGDWKTRGARHGAYPEEAGQLGVYSHAEYMLTGPAPGTQVPMPIIDELAVVSLVSDGSYALYPIDVDQARSTATHMHQSWAGAQLVDQVGRQAIGSPVVAAPKASTLEQSLLDRRIEWLRARLKALTPSARVEASKTWPDTAPRKAAEICSHNEIDDIARCLDRVEAAHEIPFGPCDPATPDPEPGSARKLSPTRA